MNSCELVTAVSTLACVLTKALSTEEAEVLAAILTQLGDSIDTILATNKISC